MKKELTEEYSEPRYDYPFYIVEVEKNKRYDIHFRNYYNNLEMIYFTYINSLEDAKLYHGVVNRAYRTGYYACKVKIEENIDIGK